MKPPRFTPADWENTKREMELNLARTIVILNTAKTHGFTIVTLAGSVSFGHHAWDAETNSNSTPGQAMQLLIDWQQDNHKCLTAGWVTERREAA